MKLIWSDNVKIDNTKFFRFVIYEHDDGSHEAITYVKELADEWDFSAVDPILKRTSLKYPCR